MTKVCVKCGSCEFSPRGDCRPCKREYDREYRANNKEKVSQSKKNAYLKKPEHYIARSKAHYSQNKEMVAIAGKAYRVANRDKVLAGKKKYRTENKEKIAVAEHKYYEENKQYVSERQREYVKRNPHVPANVQARRRERIGNNKLSNGIFSRLFVDQSGKCNGCTVDLSTVKIHIDHIMPLSLGGTNTDDNVQLLCARCNQTKSDKHPSDWLAQKPHISSKIS